ncbi:MAG: hypothetical protein RL625_544 [Gemmatimonadota bacterium]
MSVGRWSVIMRRLAVLGSWTAISVDAQRTTTPTVSRQTATLITTEPCHVADTTCIAPPVAREFRGLWVAAVSNIDWPSKPGLSVAEAKRELEAILDRAQGSGLNAVILQVRPAGDALYRSSLEPWSEYLTGRQGRAPSPRWDPLAYAVEAAHQRGLELHAWFNPYRARHPSAKGPLARSHLTNRQPALVKRYGTHLWMDPGEPAVLAHTVRVVMDVVRRYDIDGVHVDDYFYPYKERDRRGQVIPFPDDASYARYQVGGGLLVRDDWRRDNVDRLVHALHDSIHVVKPWVKFGVSPFGIWRPGSPEVVKGFDAYSELYADARKWLQEGWVDYFAPQLYWPHAAPAQPYTVLLRWWAEQNAFGRHLWPGNHTNRVADRSRVPWAAEEMLQQVTLTRADSGASGNIHFSAIAFLDDRDSVATRLRREAYAGTALVPASPWLQAPAVGATRVEVRRTGSREVVARLRTIDGERPQWWVVQMRAVGGGWRSQLVHGSATEIALTAPVDRLVVRPVDRRGIEGPAVAMRVAAP